MMNTMEVWYKLDDAQPSQVSLSNDANVDDLKNAIKAKWANRLADVDAPQLKVFAAGADQRRTS